MLTIINRKELYITMSMQEQSRVRDILDTNEIEYSIKTINRNSPSALSDTRARTGTLGQNMDLVYQYIIYVHKQDYEKAKHLIK